MVVHKCLYLKRVGAKERSEGLVGDRFDYTYILQNTATYIIWRG